MKFGFILHCVMALYWLYDTTLYIKNYSLYSVSERKKGYNRFAFNTLVIIIYSLTSNIKNMYYPTISSFILNNIALLSFLSFLGAFGLVVVSLLRFTVSEDEE